RLTVTRNGLGRRQNSRSDDILWAREEAEAEKARHAAALVDELTAELAGCAPDAVVSEFRDAERCESALGTRYDGVADELRLVTVALKVYGTEGRQCLLDEAETEREHAEAED